MKPRLLIAALAGLAQAASLATPWDGQPVWWLQLAAQAVLVWLLISAGSARQSAITAWFFGLTSLSATFGWLFTSMHTYGGLAAPVAALAVVALAGVLSLYLAVISSVYYRLRHIHWFLGAMVFGACWLLSELARAEWFTGFPWGASGYAHIDGPLAAYARWVGVYGIGYVAAVLAFCLVVAVRSALQRNARLSFMAPLLLILIIAGLKPWALRQMDTQSGDSTLSTGRLSLALLQGNIPQDEKFQMGTGVDTALRWYGQGLRDAKASLIVLPETALPLLPSDMPAGYWTDLQAHLDQTGQAALIGTPLGSYDEGYTNSVRGLSPDLSTPYRYDKHHLVPFGEFIPPLFKWFTRMMNIPLGDFNRGSMGQASFAWQGQRLAPNVCYEDLFGEELAVRFVQPEQAPTVLVNVSNLAWFGDGQAIDQHIQISRMRTLELQRPMVRATNTGATVLIDHRGVVKDQLPRSTRGVLMTDVEGRVGTTPFAWVAGRFGLRPWWITALAILVVAAFAARRRR